MNVVHAKTHDIGAALEMLDELRSMLKSGEVVGFVAVGIRQDDSSPCWTATTQRVSRLRMMGALAAVSYRYQEDEDFG